MSTTLNFAKKAIVPLTILAASLGFAQPASAINADGGRLRYGLYWYEATADGKGRAHAATSDTWKAMPLASTIYDPRKPTMIYFHGWQPGAHGKRENFQWEFNGKTRDTLKAWKAEGWNVAMYDWSQFADDGVFPDYGLSELPIAVSYVEAKVWSRLGASSMRYRYRDALTNEFKYSVAQPSSEDLNLPNWTADSGRWGGLGRENYVNAAVQFIYGIRPDSADGMALYQKLVPEYKLGSPCEDFVKTVACRVYNGGGGKLCSTTKPMWEEIYADKVCKTPSVGDLAVLDIMRAMPNQTGEVRYAGHSLGHQLATRTAMYFWGAYHQGRSNNFKKFLPRSVALLDPYATASARRYFAKGFTSTEGNLAPLTRPASGLISKEEGTTADRVFHYINAMKRFSIESETIPGSTTARKGPFGEPFDAQYIMSTALARVSGSTHNPRLINTIPSQRLYFDYMTARFFGVDTGTPDLGARHNGAKFWFFAQAFALAPVNATWKLDKVTFPVALTAFNYYDPDYLRLMRDKNVHFAHYHGRSTFEVEDDTFIACGKDSNFLGGWFAAGDYSCPGVQIAPLP